MDQPTPGFEADIKPLFRERDRRVMRFRLDLWAYEDVKADAQRVLATLESGEMPCDGAWPKDRVERVRAWVEGGCPP